MHPNGNSPAPEEGPLATGERFRPLALAALTVALLALCAIIAYPFLSAVAWGVALAVIAWPLHAWVLRHLTGNRTAAALLSAGVVVAAVAVPCALVAREMAREATSAANQMRESDAKGTLRDRLAGTPGAADLVAWADRTGVDIDAEVGQAARAYLGSAAALAQGSVMALLQAAIAVFILYYMLRDRAELRAAVRRLLPMRAAEADRMFDGAAGSVHANLYAALVTSAINAVTGGLMFWVLGLPSPVTWSVVMFVLGVLPVVGAFLVWVPAAAYLAASGNWGGAAALTAWGVASNVLVSTILYTRLSGDRMRLHPVPALVAFVGGIAVFGASGMVLGPAILAVTVAVLEVWHARATGEPLPAPEAQPAPAAPEPPARGIAVAPVA